jgi:tetratricopeptide (TPR) repeat protein
MDSLIEFEWIINGKLNSYKFSKFLEQLVTEEKYFDVIHYFELLIQEGFESELNDYCKRHYCKALYNLLKQEETIEKSFEFVEKITSNSEQKPLEQEHFNQYVNSIKFLVKKIKKSNNPNYNTVYKLLSKLNPDILSTNEMEMVSNEGKDYVNVSSKELYYTLYIKSLVKLEKFELCIAVADKALKTVDKWNYENDVWITSRVHYSKCRLANNFKEDVKGYIDFARYKNKWFLYSKVADVLFRQGLIDDSVIFYAKSIVTANRNDVEGLVNVLYDFATLIVDKHEDIAKEMFVQCYQIRKTNGWNIGPGLKYHVKLLELRTDTKVNFRNLQRKVVKLTDMSHGEISMYDDGKNIGYIKMDNGKNVRFKGDKKRSKDYREKRQVFFDTYFDINIKKSRAKNLFFTD